MLDIVMRMMENANWNVKNQRKEEQKVTSELLIVGFT